jgi:2-C-methyl-D-erythritol 4-phosphate cytidylyltransferase
VIVAAGASSRFSSAAARGGPQRKPFLKLGGSTVLEHACAAFDAVAAIEHLVLVLRVEDLTAVERMGLGTGCLRKVAALVEGGAERIDSVRAGVDAVPRGATLIAVHDAARPLVQPRTIEKALRVAARTGAALVASPVRDTIKISATGEQAESTLDRSVLWAAQTPQVFRATLLRELLERAQTEQFKPTDEAALHERFVGPVAIVEGDPSNLKITTPSDLVLAEAILRARREGEGA